MKTTKELLGILICIALLASLCPYVVLPSIATEIVDSGTCGIWGDNLTWILYENGNLVIDGIGEMQDFYDSAPWGTSISSVIIKDQVTSIGRQAFSNCSSLSSAAISDSVSMIGDYAFYGCGMLSVTLPNNLKSIGDYSFCNCGELRSIVVPASVKSIGNSAFFNCVKLVVVNINYGVVIIGASAFSDCENLSKVTVPESVIMVGANAFSNTAWYNAQTDGLVYIGKVAYKYKGIMLQNTSIVLKSDCKGIADLAFSNYNGLKSISIPESVTFIGTGAFLNCKYLSDISIPDSVTTIESSAFDGTAWYDAQPDGVVYAGKVAYRYKGSMPDNTSIVLRNDCLGIAGNAFWACKNLVSITIPGSVTNIGNVFGECESLISVKLEYGIEHIDKYAFARLPISTINIPDSVISIGSYAFMQCPKLLSVIIPNSVMSIGESAFRECSVLSSVTIGNEVKNIAPYVFFDCSELLTVTIGSGVKSIRESAFSGCTKISDVYYHKTEDQWKNISLGKGNEPLIVAEFHLHGPSFTINPISKPTCTEDGYGNKVCDFCGFLMENSIVLPAFGHDWGEWMPVYGNPDIEQRVCKNDPSHIEARSKNPLLTGDVDGNGSIEPADARLALRISLGLMTDGDKVMTPEMQARADVTGDGEVLPADARLILRKSLGLPVEDEGWKD